MVGKNLLQVTLGKLIKLWLWEQVQHLQRKHLLWRSIQHFYFRDWSKYLKIIQTLMNLLLFLSCTVSMLLYLIPLDFHAKQTRVHKPISYGKNQRCFKKTFLQRPCLTFLTEEAFYILILGAEAKPTSSLLKAMSCICGRNARVKTALWSLMDTWTDQQQKTQHNMWEPNTELLPKIRLLPVTC